MGFSVQVTWSKGENVQHVQPEKESGNTSNLQKLFSASVEMVQKLPRHTLLYGRILA